MSRRRKILYVVTVAVLAMLLLLPGTGWFVRTQVGVEPGMAGDLLTGLGIEKPAALALPNVFRHPERAERARAEVVRRHFDDFGVRLAAAMQREDGEDRIRAVRDLCRDFPNEPAAHAALLRVATGGGRKSGMVRVGHQEDQDRVTELREGHAPLNRSQPSSEPDATELVRAFLASAEAGERLAPDNAFFPAMRTVGLFARGSDAEAMDALQRAAAKPVWDEYIPEEAVARWALLVKARGSEVGTVVRLADSSAIVFPHYAQLRGAARVATGKAVTAELAGRGAEGIATRQAVARLGAKMRSDASTLIGSLVGQAMTRIAAVRPGGTPYLKKVRGTDGEQHARQIVDAYSAYLESQGEAGEAAWYRAEIGAAQKAKAVVSNATQDTLFGVPEVESVMAAWAVSRSLLTNAVAVIAFGLIYALMMRLSPSLRSGGPMEPPLRWAFGLALLVPATAAAMAALACIDAPGIAFTDTVGLAIFLAVIPPIRGRYGARAVGRGLTLAALLLFCLGGSGLLLSALIDGIRQTATIGGCSTGHTLLLVSGAALVLCAVAPVLMHLAFAVLARPLRVPVSFAIARGFSALTGPVACLLLLGFAVAAVFTVRQEASAIRALGDMIQHEGRYQAQRIGHVWPAPVPAPAR
jgi:hypothetical protein